MAVLTYLRTLLLNSLKTSCLLLKIYSHLTHSFTFCDDLNLLEVSWSNDNKGLIYSSSPGSRINCLPEDFTVNNFFQINNIPNRPGTLLDLIFVHFNLYRVFGAFTPVLPVDRYHPALPIDFILITNIAPIDPSHYHFNFRETNYFLINQFLVFFDWLKTISKSNVGSTAYAFFDAFHVSIATRTLRKIC